MKTFIRDGRKFVQSQEGGYYRYGVVIATLIATAVATLALLVIGLFLFLGEVEEILQMDLVVKGVGIVAIYAGCLTGKIFFNIIQKF